MDEVKRVINHFRGISSGFQIQMPQFIKIQNQLDTAKHEQLQVPMDFSFNNPIDDDDDVGAIENDRETDDIVVMNAQLEDKYGICQIKHTKGKFTIFPVLIYLGFSAFLFITISQTALLSAIVTLGVIRCFICKLTNVPRAAEKIVKKYATSVAREV